MNKGISAENLSKTFGSTVAAENISFSVEKGEIFGFLGPNGAGKTTTVRMLTGLLRPDSGRAFIDGIDITKDPIGAKMKMGVIPETSNIYADLTAKQNLILAGSFYGIGRHELKDRAERMLKRIGLYEHRNIEVREFSKGMKQKVSVASAMLNDSSVLFLDEPAAGLDVLSRRLIRDMVTEAKDSGITVFLTSHDIQEASVICERVAVINRGRIAAVDTPENLKRIFEETRSVEVSFSKIVEKSSLEVLRNTEKVKKLGDKMRIYTADPDRLVKELASFAERKKLVFKSLHILGTSLEDAFIKLTESGVDYEN